MCFWSLFEVWNVSPYSACLTSHLNWHCMHTLFLDFIFFCTFHWSLWIDDSRSLTGFQLCFCVFICGVLIAHASYSPFLSDLFISFHVAWYLCWGKTAVMLVQYIEWCCIRTLDSSQHHFLIFQLLYCTHCLLFGEYSLTQCPREFWHTAFFFLFFHCPSFMFSSRLLFHLVTRSNMLDVVHMWNNEVETFYEDQCLNQKRIYSQRWDRTLRAWIPSWLPVLTIP